MLHAAAMLCVLIVLWMLGAQAWSFPQAWTVAAAAGLGCVLITWRIGGLSSAYARAPRLVLLFFARSGAVARGALSVMRRAVSADVTLKPALVRVKTRAGSAAERATFAHALTATPGMAVVETDADGLLLHVMNEDKIDATELGRLEHAIGSRRGAAS
ncbi:MAG: Na+/H+ antiporter subunit E [Hyphomonadaceae bacterium]